MKKTVSIILAAALCALLLCPAPFAGADPLPTSACLSGLTARFTPGDGAVGTIAIEADAEGIAAGEYINVSVYASVGDISDVSGEPVIFRIFKADDSVSGGRLSIAATGPIEKLLG